MENNKVVCLPSPYPSYGSLNEEHLQRLQYVHDAMLSRFLHLSDLISETEDVDLRRAYINEYSYLQNTCGFSGEKRNVEKEAKNE